VELYRHKTEVVIVKLIGEKQVIREALCTLMTYCTLMAYPQEERSSMFMQVKMN
jgi:hypothetical protein